MHTRPRLHQTKTDLYAQHTHTTDEHTRHFPLFCQEKVASSPAASVRSGDVNVGEKGVRQRQALCVNQLCSNEVVSAKARTHDIGRTFHVRDSMRKGPQFPACQFHCPTPRSLTTANPSKCRLMCWSDHEQHSSNSTTSTTSHGLRQRTTIASRQHATTTICSIIATNDEPASHRSRPNIWGGAGAGNDATTTADDDDDDKHNNFILGSGGLIRHPQGLVFF